jgi:hypothetical protein
MISTLLFQLVGIPASGSSGVQQCKITVKPRSGVISGMPDMTWLAGCLLSSMRLASKLAVLSFFMPLWSLHSMAGGRQRVLKPTTSPVGGSPCFMALRLWWWYWAACKQLCWWWLALIGYLLRRMILTP